jgi:hypothetical protein
MSYDIDGSLPVLLEERAFVSHVSDGFSCSSTFSSDIGCYVTGSVLSGTRIGSKLLRLSVRYTRPLCGVLEGPHLAAMCILLCVVCLVVSKS